jgi:hypothetical protein
MSVPYCFDCERYHTSDTAHKPHKNASERKEARARLLELVKPGMRVRTILRHVSRSGMQREISLAVSSGDEIIQLDYWASKLLGYRIGKHGGIVMGGCGMDMGFALVYNLGGMLWPNGTTKPHGKRNGEADRAGGYAIKHDWM